MSIYSSSPNTVILEGMFLTCRYDELCTSKPLKTGSIITQVSEYPIPPSLPTPLLKMPAPQPFAAYFPAKV